MSLKPKIMDFTATWNALQETVQGVITLGHVPRAVWNDRFSDVYSLCVAYPEPLADRLYAETKNFLTNHVARLLEKVQAGGENNLLKNYYVEWALYNEGVGYLHRLYLYLNQQHIKKQKVSDAEMIYGGTENTAGEQMEIGELGLEVWRVDMILPLGTRLVKLLLEAIEQDRAKQGPTVPVEAVQGTILSFVHVQKYKIKSGLQLYQTLFEDAFLNASGEFYQREASRLLQECNVSQYMERVIAKLDEESQRARRFLHMSSVLKVRQKCEKHMVAEHLHFLYSECNSMVQEERRKDLANMYPLLKSVSNGVSVLVETVLDHIRNQGLKAISNLRGDNTPTQFVESMLTVHAKYRELIQDVFQGDQSFMGALDKACSSVINYRGSEGKQLCRSPELLAKYCDWLLKKSSKGVTESEVEERLSQSITIFKYIDDKDIFQKFYSRMLAKRLIHQQSQSMDAEEAMINRLKQACGYEFTNKLHRMFTDISVSADLNNKFNAFLKKDNIDLGVSFSIHVLQAGAWPLGQTAVTSFNLPQQLEKSVQMFENFYHNHFSGRKLTWLHHLCQAELKLCYTKRPYLVTVQTFQMAVLLLFETTDEMSCKELKDTLQLSADQFQKHAASLVDCKMLTSDTEELSPETILRLNLDYSNKRTKFRITAAVQKESPQEVEHTMNSVEDDRKLYLQAAIVRIMKARKVLRHNELIQEVCSQSRVSFAPSIAMIKKCIEALIDKQYIERTPHSSEEYSYVA